MFRQPYLVAAATLVDRVAVDVTGLAGNQVVAAADMDGCDEMLMQVINELDDAILQSSRDGEEVKDGEVLNVLAESDTACMRTDGLAEFGREQEDG